MNNNNIDLPESEIRLLGIYRCVQEQKPCQISMEDMVELPKLAEEIKEAEKQDKVKLERIAKLEASIEEKRIQVEALQSQLNKKLQYLKQFPVKPVKEVNHNGSVSLSPINETTVLEALKSNPYGLGNAEICHKLGLTGNKAEQNKAYSVAKSLQSKGLVKSENRQWKIV